jgi:GNAT superfamily N-acetyltransferase
MELAFLAIDPAYQGAGLGSKLLAHCLGQLPPEAVCWLVTEVDNTAAARLYAKHGFHNLHTIADAHPCPLYLWIRPGKFDIPMPPLSIPPTLSKCPTNAALSSTMIT